MELMQKKRQFSEQEPEYPDNDKSGQKGEEKLVKTEIKATCEKDNEVIYRLDLIQQIHLIYRQRI